MYIERWYLKNFKEFKFVTQPIIKFYDEDISHPYATNSIDDAGYLTFHTSLRAVKDRIRSENTVKGDPRFKWVEYLEDTE